MVNTRSKHDGVVLVGGWKDLPVPDAPQTIRQNWIPFLTFFLRRIIFCREEMVLVNMTGNRIAYLGSNE